MPQIVELSIIDGDLWARIGKPGDFPSGISLWTPDEKRKAAKDAQRELIEAMQAFMNDAAKATE